MTGAGCSTSIQPENPSAPETVWRARKRAAAAASPTLTVPFHTPAVNGPATAGETPGPEGERSSATLSSKYSATEPSSSLAVRVTGKTVPTTADPGSGDHSKRRARGCTTRVNSTGAGALNGSAGRNSTDPLWTPGARAPGTARTSTTAESPAVRVPAGGVRESQPGAPPVVQARARDPVLARRISRGSEVCPCRVENRLSAGAFTWKTDSPGVTSRATAASSTGRTTALETTRTGTTQSPAGKPSVSVVKVRVTLSPPARTPPAALNT